MTTYLVQPRVSDALQWSDLDLAYAVCLISSVESKLSESRSDTVWNSLWKEAMTLATELNISVSRERSCRVTNVPRRLDDCVLTTTTLGHRHNLATKEEYRCHVYYAVIDCVLEELKRQFNDTKIS